MQASSVIKVIQEFRKYDSDIPIGTVLCFLQLMEEPGLTVSQAIERVKLSKQSASRNLNNLTHRARRDKEGLNLARTERDPNDYRITVWYLNEEGQKLAEAIRSL